MSDRCDSFAFNRSLMWNFIMAKFLMQIPEIYLGILDHISHVSYHIQRRMNQHQGLLDL